MKKIIAMLLVLTMVLCCFAGCGTKGKTLEDIKEAGKLVIATSPDFPPFEYIDNKAVVGIEIDLMEKICEKLGVELKIEQIGFDSVLPGVQAGKYDAGVSGISVTPAREENTLFADPYCLAAQAIVVVEGSTIAGKGDLAGKNIAVQSGTTAESYCMDNNYSISPFEANPDAQTALTTGKVDAWVIDDLTAAEMVKAYNAGNPDKKLVILDEPMTSEPYAFAFSFGSETLVEEINKIVNEMVKDGTVKAIFDKYEAPYTAPAVK